MPIQHVVFFKFRELTKEEETKAKQLILELKDKIEGIIDITFGPTFTKDRSKGK